MALQDQNKIELLNAQIQVCRSIILTTVEFELGDDPRWPAIKSRILRAFGDRGLQGQAQMLFSKKSAHDSRGGLE